MGPVAYVVVVLTRLLLAVVFGVAGVAKLTDSTGSRRSMAAFGVPAMWTPTFAWLVPLAEITCAAALVSAGWAWWGAVGASAILVAFTAAIAVNITLGRAPDCHCFGQLHSSPAGWPTLLRNVALAGLAVYVVAEDAGNTSPALTAVLRAATGGRVTVPVWVVALVVAWAIAGVWLSRSLPLEERIPQRVAPPLGATRATPAAPRAQEPSAWTGSELPVGAPAPAFDLQDLDGGTVTLSALHSQGHAHGTPILLLFTQPHCAACDGVLSDVGRWQQAHAERLVIVPISLYSDSIDAIRAKASRHNLQGVLLQRDGAIGDAYGADQLPSAVLVTEGRVASRIATGREAIRALLDHATRSPLLEHEESAHV